ncbi:hypothetical protein ACSBR1_016465 [Camellia fascicularis]
MPSSGGDDFQRWRWQPAIVGSDGGAGVRFGGYQERESNEDWKNWKWRSSKDMFGNGAYFVPSGYGSCAPPYTSSQLFTASQGSWVPFLTSDAGPLQCVADKAC